MHVASSGAKAPLYLDLIVRAEALPHNPLRAGLGDA